VVSIGRIYHELPVDSVVSDDVDSVRALVTRLAGLGHRRLMWVDAHYSATFLDGRQAGFLQGCVRNWLDLSQQRLVGSEIYHWDRIVAHDTLLDAVRAGTTAMLCANDSIAMQVIEALESGGVRVPQDVSVTGFDAWQATAGRRQVTSVDPHFSEMGRAAVRLATQRLTQLPGPPCTLSVRADIVDGETIAAPEVSPSDNQVS
jgi:LacI family transcriptional regulator